ncbi:MAG: phage major capsid protein [Alphaproteobacteria bacterium]|nr:phage major capsid protein [Alphaproteobacteria bacterium]
MSIQEVTEGMYALGNAWEQFKQVNENRLNEIERKGAADPLHDGHLKKINDALDHYKSRLDRIETVQARPGREMSTLGYSGQDQAEYKAAFNTYLRKGMDSGLEQIQSKALSVGTDANGGYLVPNQLADLIVQIVNESSPLRALATVETISSDSLDLIEDPTDVGAAWGDETTVRSAETSAPTLGRNTIDTFEMYAQPQATQKLIDDGSIDIEQWIARKVADKMARLEATAFISGDGTTQPKGLLSYAAGTSWGTIEQVNTGTPATVTADSLIQLYYALKDDYARNASFLMHRTTVQAVRLLKEATTNQYLWQPGLAAGRPDTLLGVPVALAADMPVPAASALSVVVADFKRAYLIVDRIGIRTLRDPFTAKPFVKFYTTKRVGGKVVNTDAIKILKLV